jgi:MoxR-like ATPase
VTTSDLLPLAPDEATAHAATGNAIVNQLQRVVLGQEPAIRETVAALLARGHVLLEGVPGTAKTLLVRAMSLALGLEFRRIQFTPDLMPSDITGVNLLAGQGSFTFRAGPIFGDLVLGDEINRAPAKTQAALLEAMQERRVTVDGTSYPLPDSFTVFATQNPIEFEGTYPLPEAELDRFLVKVVVGYPEESIEQGILSRVLGGFEAEASARPLRSSDGTVGDEALADAVRSALRHDSSTTDLDIEVSVEGGVVRLFGTVAGMEDVDNAEAVAGRVPGIIDVVEELRVPGV